MNYAIIIGAALAGVVGLCIVVFGVRRRWIFRNSSKAEKGRVTRRLWRRGNALNYVELCQKPDGGKVYNVHRAYDVQCPRCLEKHRSGWQWTVNYEEGVDPVATLGSPRLEFICKRCNDVQTFVPQLGPSEWQDKEPGN